MSEQEQDIVARYNVGLISEEEMKLALKVLPAGPLPTPREK